MCSWPKLPSTTMAEGGFSDSDRRGITNSHLNLFESKKSDKARVRVVKQEPGHPNHTQSEMQTASELFTSYNQSVAKVRTGSKLGLTKRVS